MGEIFSLEPPSAPLKEIMKDYPNVFSDQLGCLNGTKVHLNVNQEARPKFFKPRPVSLALKDKVEEELNRLVAEGILSPVQFSKWAAPIVPVVKHNGSIRICINQVSCLDIYPLPRIKELFAKLSGGKYFSKLDLSQAYLQLPLKEMSKEFVTINTHKGLFRYNRLPFGVASAPAIFQWYMETLLQDCKGVTIYLDDILVTGSSVENHLENLKVVLGKLDKAGLHLNKDKCKFRKTKVEYLGQVIDHERYTPIR